MRHFEDLHQGSAVTLVASVSSVEVNRSVFTELCIISYFANKWEDDMNGFRNGTAKIIGNKHFNILCMQINLTVRILLKCILV